MGINKLISFKEYLGYVGAFFLVDCLTFCQEVIELNKDGEVTGTKLIYDKF